VFKCANLRTGLVQGKMWISKNYIGFAAKGLSRVVVLPFRDVTKIEKQGFQIHWVLNSICVKTQGTEVKAIGN
jgi:hypothetical protein